MRSSGGGEWGWSFGGVEDGDGGNLFENIRFNTTKSRKLNKSTLPQLRTLQIFWARYGFQYTN